MFGWYENFSLKRVQIIWNASRWSEKCPDDLKSVQMIWKVTRWSEKRPDDLKSVRMIWKVSRWSGKRPDDLKSGLIRWSAQCVGDLESVPVISKISKSSIKCAFVCKYTFCQIWIQMLSYSGIDIKTAVWRTFTMPSLRTLSGKFFYGKSCCIYTFYKYAPRAQKF